MSIFTYLHDRRWCLAFHAHDPLTGWELPLFDFVSWVVLHGTLIFGSLALWFFMTAHRTLSVGFLIATILFGLVWRIVAQRLS